MSLATAIAILMIAEPARVEAQTTYHVDWQEGCDSADGLTPQTAWKRAPGDSRAGPVPRTVALGPGDTLLFRGGVAYRGTVVLRVSGDPERPIRLLGEGWGPGRATIDGGEPVRARPCRSKRDCAGEPGWRRLWHIVMPRHAPAYAPLFQAGSVLMRAGPRGFESQGMARTLPGKRIAIVRPFEGTRPAFSVGMGRPGLLLVAGRHVDVAGFAFANFADLPQRGPFAGSPLTELQPLEGVRLAGLVLESSGAAIPLRRAVAPKPSVAGHVRGPA
ncbi:MAG: hypothetical protein KGZ61_06385 [Sandarakinorhabdus sp.]|nr:hypothetical protein [Sandarakinorhabdus sp.]